MRATRAAALLVAVVSLLPSAALKTNADMESQVHRVESNHAESSRAESNRVESNRAASSRVESKSVASSRMEAQLQAAQVLERERMQAAFQALADLQHDLQVYSRGKVYRSSVSTTLLARTETNTGTLSPEERAAAHSSRFEKEWAVHLNVTRAREENLRVGLSLDIDADYNPVSVLKVRQKGLVHLWNTENPDKALFVGDEIVKVNGIMWHHNSQTFVERIRGQLLSAKVLKPGTSQLLSLVVQRPRRESQIRSQSQREDLHMKLYSREFVANISFKGVRHGHIVAMGWKLNSSKDWDPVSIERLDSNGLVALYNNNNPDAKIMPGDQILKVNNVQWHHSAKVFLERFRSQFYAGMRSERANSHAKNVLALHIRRPRSVKDVPEEQVYTKQYVVDLDLLDNKPIGWYLGYSSDLDPLTVKGISQNSHLDIFNKANPSKSVHVGDSVLSVNNFLWRRNSSDFLRRVDSEIQQARPKVNQVPNRTSMQLLMQRQVVQPIVQEWTVTLPARPEMLLGIVFHFSGDEFPLAVSRIRRDGAVFEYNNNCDYNPDDRIRSGDLIVKVNDVLWRQDSVEFEKRLFEEYSNSQETGNMSIFLRRPLGVQDDSDESTTEPFEKEFSVQLPLDYHKPLGWQLDADSHRAQVTIAKIYDAGAVHDWNEMHPMSEIQGGDVIVKADRVPTGDGEEQPIDRASLQAQSARDGKMKSALKLLLRRPRRAAAAAREDDALPGSGEAGATGGGRPAAGGSGGVQRHD